MKPLLLSQSDTSGGAARAALRLHRALLNAGYLSHMLVRDRQTDLPNVCSLPSTISPKALVAARCQLGNAMFRFGEASVRGARSGNWLPSSMLPTIKQFSPDVVNLHWVGGETISIAEIGQLPYPSVWTIHDMWLFCGSEHYAEDTEESRWRKGYPVRSSVTAN